MPKKTTPGQVTTSANFIQNEGAGQPAPSTGMEGATEVKAEVNEQPAEVKAEGEQTEGTVNVDAPDAPQMPQDQPHEVVTTEDGQPQGEPEPPTDPVVGYSIVTEAETEKLVVVEVTESQRREMAEDEPFYTTEDEANADLEIRLMALLNDESGATPEGDQGNDSPAPDADAEGTPHGNAAVSNDPEAMTAEEIEAEQKRLRDEAQALEDRRMQAQGMVRVRSKMNRMGHTIGSHNYDFVAGQELYVHEGAVPSLLHGMAIELL